MKRKEYKEQVHLDSLTELREDPIEGGQRETSYNNSRILTRQEVAKMLKVDYSTMWRWNRDGILPARRVGPKRIYYLYDDIMQLLLEKEGRKK